MTAQGLREAELAVCEVSTEIPFSNDNVIMHNFEFELYTYSAPPLKSKLLYCVETGFLSGTY